MPSSADNEAEVFANAYNLARANATLRKAGNQRDLSKVSDLIALKEADFQATPLPTDTLWMRQQRLLALKLAPLGASAQNLTNVLTAALGASFLGLRVLVLGGTESVANFAPSNFQALTLVGKWLRLVAPVAGPQITADEPQWASYGNLEPTNPALDALAIGDMVTVQGENGATGEVVEVLALQLASDGTPQFQATFMQGHDTGSTVTTAPFPRWTSSQSLLLVGLTQSASMDPIVRAKVDTIMGKICRGVTQWATIYNDTGSSQPFRVGQSPLGTATVGSISL